MSKVKKNFFYSILYQMLIIIMPLITSPYISRVLRPEGVGLYSYSYSIAYYFIVFAMLGLANYGSRTIAINRDDKLLLSKTFISIYVMQFITCSLSFISYLLFCFIYGKLEIISFMQVFYVMSSFLDISWFFYGLEEIKLTVVRHGAIKIITVLLIFLLVKNPSDIFIYTLIMSLGAFISQLVQWPFLKARIIFTKISAVDIIQHLKPNIILFIPVIAISFYKMMDKIMLGYMSDMVQVGYYESAEKLLKIPSGLILSLGGVMLPKITSLVHSENNKDDIKKYINYSFLFMTISSVALSFGIMAIAKEFIPFFFGDLYNPCILLIYVLGPTIICAAWQNIIVNQFLIPYQKDIYYTKSVLCGALINFTLNLFLIKHFQAFGAALATLVAELVVLFSQVMYTRKEIDYKTYSIELIKSIISGVLMFIIVSFIPSVSNVIITLLIKIVTGAVIYIFIIAILFRKRIKKEFIKLKKR